jgi:uncharacterized protein YkwD
VKKRVAIFICMIALLGLLAVPGAASASTGLTRLERQVVSLINQKRAAHHLARLRVNTKLVSAARSHSREMGAKHYFGHCSADGAQFTSRLIHYGYTRAGCRSWSAGEDIAWGSGLYGTALATVKAWMKSAPHRRVILHGTFRDIGIGAVVHSGGYGGCSGPVTFFTMDLGRRIS